jgi:hypothetical protein
MAKTTTTVKAFDPRSLILNRDKTRRNKRSERPVPDIQSGWVEEMKRGVMIEGTDRVLCLHVPYAERPEDAKPDAKPPQGFSRWESYLTADGTLAGLPSVAGATIKSPQSNERTVYVPVGMLAGDDAEALFGEAIREAFAAALAHLGSKVRA